MSLSFVAKPSAVDYEVVEAGEGDFAGRLRAGVTGSYGPEPTFRAQLPPDQTRLLVFDVVGRFDGDAVAQRFSSTGAWLPEDTYRPTRAIQRENAAGGWVEDGKSLMPTANPLGYLVQPPQALTTIEAAAALTGRAAPISAVRVRLSGIDQAGEASWARIENAVRSIREGTGLDVIVVAGGAPARMLVDVGGHTSPGKAGQETWRMPDEEASLRAEELVFRPAFPDRTVAGFGVVEEPWIVQGASISYLRAGAAQHGWMVALVAVAALAYVWVLFTSVQTARVPQHALRRAVGWSRGRVLTRELMRVGALGLTGAGVGAAAATWGLQLGGQQPPGAGTVAAAASAALFTALVAGVMAVWPAVCRPPVQALHGERPTRETREVLVFGSGPMSLALNELLRLRRRVLLCALVGAVSVTGVGMLLAFQAAFASQAQVTVLGQILLVDTGGVQLAAVGTAVALGLALLGEVIWQSTAQRRRVYATLRALGWSRVRVARVVLFQGVALGTIAALFGVAVAASVLTAAQLAPLPQALSLVAPVLPTAAGLAGLVATAAAARVFHDPPARALRAS